MNWIELNANVTVMEIWNTYRICPCVAPCHIFLLSRSCFLISSLWYTTYLCISSCINVWVGGIHKMTESLIDANLSMCTSSILISFLKVKREIYYCDRNRRNCLWHIHVCAWNEWTEYEQFIPTPVINASWRQSYE